MADMDRDATFGASLTAAEREKLRQAQRSVTADRPPPLGQPMTSKSSLWAQALRRRDREADQ